MIDSITINKEKEKNSIIPKKEKFYLPELNGELVSGQLISKETKQPMANKIMALSIIGNPTIYKIFKTNTLGKFYFNLYENYTSSDVILQVIDSQNEKYKIVLDDSIPNFIQELSFSNIVLNATIKNWLIKKSINNQIENAFFQSKKDSILSIIKPKIFYGKPSITYKLDDYTRFPTVKETFLEIVKRVVVRKRKGKNKIVLFANYTMLDKQLDKLTSLILIDGIPIQDHNILLDYNPQFIDKIEIVFDKYFFGSSVYDGILSIKTKKGDFSLPKTVPYFIKKINSPLGKKLYYSPNYGKKNNILKRIPDNRSQIAWFPEINISKSVKKINFFTSDITGVFEIKLDGFNEKNEYIEIREYLWVE